MTASLQLRSGKDRSLTRRHPWIYTGAIGAIRGQPKSGETVRVHAADGRFLA